MDFTLGYRGDEVRNVRSLYTVEFSDGEMLGDGSGYNFAVFLDRNDALDALGSCQYRRPGGRIVEWRAYYVDQAEEGPDSNVQCQSLPPDAK